VAVHPFNPTDWTSQPPDGTREENSDARYRARATVRGFEGITARAEEGSTATAEIVRRARRSC
jgi:hypothetical protein